MKTKLIIKSFISLLTKLEKNVAVQREKAKNIRGVINNLEFDHADCLKDANQSETIYKALNKLFEGALDDK